MPAAPLDPWFLEMLVCPETRMPLQQAAPDVVAKLNAAVEKGALLYVSGQRVSDKLDGALVRQDGEVCYGIHNGMPYMRKDQQIPLRQLR
jgi:uncharacterized protein YbaR (Trm112 family)